MRKINKLYFDTTKNLSNNIIEDLDDISMYESVAFIGFYDEVLKLVNSLTSRNCKIQYANLDPKFEDLYYVEIGKDKLIFICKSKDEECNTNYLPLECKYAYFSDQLKFSKNQIVNISDFEEYYTVSVDEWNDSEIYGENENLLNVDDILFGENEISLECNCCNKESSNDNMYSITVNGYDENGNYWGKSYYSSDKLNKEEAHDLLNNVIKR